MKRSDQSIKINSSEITDESLFRRRRALLQSMAAGILVPRSLFAADIQCQTSVPVVEDQKTPYESIIGYNNYYEFTTNKEVVIHLAKELTTHPWTLTVEGEVEKPFTLDIDSLISKFNQEERVYRLRCVEGWSMVVPWNGFSLCKLLKMAAPTSRAKFVEFVSLYRPEEMIGQRLTTLQWPYREGLRIDEAMHPLTILATGLYGKTLPPQNGAPLRIVVPWKYGFKSPKAITHIRLVEKPPATSWNTAAPAEYGFYANVNPEVPHPRWSQSRENRIGELRKRRTLMFNGYSEQVAHLYSNIDLKKYY